MHADDAEWSREAEKATGDTLPQETTPFQCMAAVVGVALKYLLSITNQMCCFVSASNILSWPEQLCNELQRCAAEIEVLRLSFLPGGFGSSEL